MNRIVNCVLAAILATGMSACLPGQMIKVDDFESGNLDQWTFLDFSDGQPWGPGIFDVSRGELRMAHSGAKPVPPGTPLEQNNLFAFWNDSIDPVYSNGFVRAQVRVDENENAACVGMRGDFVAGSTYSLCTVSVTGIPIGGQFHIDRFENGVNERLWLSNIDDNIPYQVGEEWIVELGAVGSRISAKVWPVGALEPLAPQWEWTDPSPLLTGQVFLLSTVQSEVSLVPGFADASFDNVYFTIPEPSAVILLLMGLVFVGGYRRR